MQLHLRKRLDLLRLRLALAIFPGFGFRIVANRKERVFSTSKAECRFVVKDLTKPDGYSWDEMLSILDVFLGRQATTQEWSQVLAWKQNSGKEAA